MISETKNQAEALCHCGKDGHALNSINCPVHGRSEMQLTEQELNLIRQWFNAVDDLTPDYLEGPDRDLGKRITEYVFERQRAALAR